jgi:Asp-tRNA(Asn)/Glu-tRNA(Gln) amidotransferase A subunit family amidase
MRAPSELAVQVGASAGELARRLASGEISARETVAAHIDRIRAVNGHLNAVVVPLFEQALIEAAVADERYHRGESLGPLHGVPITVKESYDVAGTPTTAGVSARSGRLVAADSSVVRRLRGAGAIIVGKTNVSQLLLYNESDNPVYGCTVNPWASDRAPGGSSGGEGAIVAAGGSAIGFGSDIGGSVREPAHACGICALKPTSGLLPLEGEADGWLFGDLGELLAQPGPLARTVSDLALALRVFAPPERETTRPAPAALDPTAIPVRGLRIATYVDDGFFPAAPALRRATQEAGAALRAAGSVVEEFSPPDVAEAMRIFLGLLSADGGERLERVLEQSRRDRRVSGLLQVAKVPALLRPGAARAASLVGQKRLAATMRTIRRTPREGYTRLLEDRDRYKARFYEALDKGRFDAIVCPPHALPALRHGTSFFLATAASYAMLFNLVGLPAGVVAATRVRPGEESDRPSSRDIVERAAAKVEAGSAGLPVGIQVASRPWREEVVLSVMAVLERHFRAQPEYPAMAPV